METAPQYREKSEKELALLSLLQGTQKVRPRRKGKNQGRHSETEDRRDKEAKRLRHEEPLGSLKPCRQRPRKPGGRKAGL